MLHSPFGPASRAAVPNLVGNGDLAWANGTLAAASNAGQLAGPALGGVLYAVAGAGGAFAANAVSFVVSAALIAAVRGRFRSKNPDTGTSTPETGSIWAGARFLWRSRMLLTLTAVGAVTFLATEIVAVADLPLIRHFGVGSVGYGIMNVAWGAGRGHGKVAFMQPEAALAFAAGLGGGDGWPLLCCRGRPGAGD